MRPDALPSGSGGASGARESCDPVLEKQERDLQQVLQRLQQQQQPRQQQQWQEQQLQLQQQQQQWQEQQQQQQGLPWLSESLKALLPPSFPSWLYKGPCDNSSSSGSRGNTAAAEKLRHRLPVDITAAVAKVIAAITEKQPNVNCDAAAASKAAAAAAKVKEQDTLKPPQQQQQQRIAPTVPSRARARARTNGAASQQQQQQQESEGSDWLLRHEGRRLGLNLKRELPQHAWDPRYSYNVKLSADNTVATGGLNWGSALARCCCSWGSYYFEVTVAGLGPSAANEEEAPSRGAPIPHGPAAQVPPLAVRGWDHCKTARDVAKEFEEEIVVRGHNAWGPCLRVGWGSRLASPGAPLGSNPFAYAIGSYCELPCVEQQQQQRQQQERPRCCCGCSSCSDTCGSSVTGGSSSRRDRGRGGSAGDGAEAPLDEEGATADLGTVRGAPRKRGLFVINRGIRRRLKLSPVCFERQAHWDRTQRIPEAGQGGQQQQQQQQHNEALTGLRAGQPPSHHPASEATDCAAAALDALAAATAAAARGAAAAGAARGCCCSCSVCGGAPNPPPSAAGRAPPLRVGDVVGCFVHLPGRPPAALEDPRGRASLWPFLQQGLLCDVTHESTLPRGVVHPSSFVSFSVNGRLYHKAYSPLLCCELHPAVSLFNGASAALNLGPCFAFLPSVLKQHFRPAQEMLTSVYPLKADLVKFYLLAADSSSSNSYSSSSSSSDGLREGSSPKRLRTIAEVDGLKDETPPQQQQQQQPLRFVPFDEATHMRKLHAAAPQLPSLASATQQQQQQQQLLQHQQRLQQQELQRLLKQQQQQQQLQVRLQQHLHKQQARLEQQEQQLLQQQEFEQQLQLQQQLKHLQQHKQLQQLRQQQAEQAQPQQDGQPQEQLQGEQQQSEQQQQQQAEQQQQRCEQQQQQQQQRCEQQQQQR
ncbi:hypothetical protein Esti_000107 [Eimeria stiedai]